jgi:hypothetical protein
MMLKNTTSDDRLSAEKLFSVCHPKKELHKKALPVE